MIVLDASAVVELLLRTTAGRDVADRISDPAEGLHVPHLVDVEIAQALRRYVKAREITAADAGEALSNLQALDVSRHPHEPFLDRIWALRDNISAYDAAYVALAEALPATLVTCDRRLAKAPGARAVVEVVGSGSQPR